MSGRCDARVSARPDCQFVAHLGKADIRPPEDPVRDEERFLAVEPAHVRDRAFDFFHGFSGLVACPQAGCGGRPGDDDLGLDGPVPADHVGDRAGQTADTGLEIDAAWSFSAAFEMPAHLLGHDRTIRAERPVDMP